MHPAFQVAQWLPQAWKGVKNRWYIVALLMSRARFRILSIVVLAVASSPGAGLTDTASQQDAVRASLHGTDFDDTLTGGSDDDQLHGGPGDDLLDGGPGLDLLSGGDGADRFRFNLDDLQAQPDRIDDFAPEEGDSIVLRSGSRRSFVPLTDNVRITGSVVSVRLGEDSNWRPVADIGRLDLRLDAVQKGDTTRLEFKVRF